MRGASGGEGDEALRVGAAVGEELVASASAAPRDAAAGRGGRAAARAKKAPPPAPPPRVSSGSGEGNRCPSARGTALGQTARHALPHSAPCKASPAGQGRADEG